MANVVVLGAGLGGTIAAYELRDELVKEHKVCVINNGSHYSSPGVSRGGRRVRHPGSYESASFHHVEEHQRNRAFPEIFAIGVCVAIPPIGKTPVPVGVAKPGFMIESMATATVHNISRLVKGAEPDAKGAWNVACLADFGDSGGALVARPQIPPRNVNWSSSGKWVHAAKICFEKYFLHKIRTGKSEPFYERLALQMLGIGKLKDTRPRRERMQRHRERLI